MSEISDFSLERSSSNLKKPTLNYEFESQSTLFDEDNYQIQFDQREYGVPKAIPIHSIQFNPREMGILERYSDHKCIYNEFISSTRVYLSKDLVNETVSV